MYRVEIVDYATNYTFAVVPDVTLEEAFQCIEVYKKEDQSYYDYEQQRMMKQRYKGHTKLLKKVKDKTVRVYQIYLEAYPVEII